jgi:hypothetical protein
VFAKGVDIVTLTTTAEGKTKDEAVSNALRSAVEQAFGAFISSKTDIVNDELIKDEIVSVSSGNIKKFNVLSSTVLPDGSTVVAVKADVSLTKLISFAKNKGTEVEFEGSLFAANIKLDELYALNELMAIRHLTVPFLELAQRSFDYEIEAEDPVQFGTNKVGDYKIKYGVNVKNWEVPLTITATANQNFFSAIDMLYNTLISLSLTKEEREKYKKMNKDIYPFGMAVSKKKYGFAYLRNKQSETEISRLLESFGVILWQGKISTGNEIFTIASMPGSNSTKNSLMSRVDLNSKSRKAIEEIASMLYSSGGGVNYLYIEEDRTVLYFRTVHLGSDQGLTTDKLSQIKKYTISPMDYINPDELFRSIPLYKFNLK